MGLDGTLTSHIELVYDSYDMACQECHLNPYRTQMDAIICMILQRYKIAAPIIIPKYYK